MQAFDHVLRSYVFFCFPVSYNMYMHAIHMQVIFLNDLCLCMQAWGSNLTTWGMLHDVCLGMMMIHVLITFLKRKFKLRRIYLVGLLDLSRITDHQLESRIARSQEQPRSPLMLDLQTWLMLCCMPWTFSYYRHVWLCAWIIEALLFSLRNITKRKCLIIKSFVKVYVWFCLHMMVWFTLLVRLLIIWECPYKKWEWKKLSSTSF